MSTASVGTIRREVVSLRTTPGEWDCIDVTDQLDEAVRLTEGFALIHTPHTSACILIGENDDELMLDYHRVWGTLLAAGRPYLHTSHGHLSGEAHVFCALHGPQVVLPIAGGKLALGKLQRIFFVDPTEGPRDRDIWVYSFGSSSPVQASSE
ncbi:MAG: YjbQ family protein [Propionibacteriaceae bacterium]|jgi:secondary thiamine-phosphate synthase enzyme|nr:YjbQ family protein [Propionibacteriaceae bacterium]